MDTERFFTEVTSLQTMYEALAFNVFPKSYLRAQIANNGGDVYLIPMLKAIREECNLSLKASKMLMDHGFVSGKLQKLNGPSSGSGSIVKLSFQYLEELDRLKENAKFY